MLRTYDDGLIVFIAPLARSDGWRHELTSLVCTLPRPSSSADHSLCTRSLFLLSQPARDHVVVKSVDALGPLAYASAVTRDARMLWGESAVICGCGR